MYRKDFEKLSLEELVEIIIDYTDCEIITREELEQKAKNEIDYGNYDDAMERLEELNTYADYFIYNEKYDSYDELDIYDAQRIIEKESDFDIREDLTDEDCFDIYMERLADEKRDEEA